MRWTEKRQEDVLETGLCRNLHRVRVTHILDQVAAVKRMAGRPLRVLDIGCGDGVITKRLREAFPEETIEGVDADPVRLERARAACVGVTFRQEDAGTLPYETGAFDVVLCHHVMEHVEDDRRLLSECYRALAPGGLLVLGIPHEGGAIGRILRRLHRKMYAEGEHVHFYTISGMRQTIVAQGFTGVTYAKFGLLFPQYHLHILLTWFSPTFALGHWVSQRVDATADSLIFAARKPVPVEDESVSHPIGVTHEHDRRD
jgi:ubiquinone/menaquinone biosynthesis C-methylase UbiE